MMIPQFAHFFNHFISSAGFFFFCLTEKRKCVSINDSDMNFSEAIMAIFTLTLNPAIDRHAALDRLCPGSEHFAKELSCEFGGKGINLSRALTANGCQNTAFVLLGRENAAFFEEGLNADALTFRSFYTEGRVRENFTFHVPGEKETRISFQGFSATEEVFSQIATEIRGTVKPGDFLVVAGSFPTGITRREVTGFLIGERERGVKVISDSRSLGAEELYRIRPFLIKPNDGEMALLTGKTIASREDALSALKSVAANGIEHILLSLGEKGAFLSWDGKLFYEPAPAIEALSTVGAGDSMLAGFLLALSAGKNEEDALKYAVAFGSAACLTPGTRPPRKDDILHFLSISGASLDK